MTALTTSTYAVSRCSTLELRSESGAPMDRVVDDQPGSTLFVVELSHPRSQIFRVAGICLDGVDLGSDVGKAFSIAQSVGAPGPPK
jgi:hypothetical protein